MDNSDGQESREATRHRTVLLIGLLILIWACELLVIQEATSHPDDSLPILQILKYAGRRMVLNLVGCAFFVCFFRRFSLYAVFFLGMLFSTVALTYAEYFEHPLSWTTISLQWNEGTSVAGHGISLISWQVVTLLLAAFVLKVGLREAIGRRRLPADLRRKAAVAGVTYVVLAVGFAGFYKPITRVNIGSPEYTYGYTVAWTAEFLSYDADAVLEDAIAKSAVKSRVLTDQETSIYFGDHIVVVQVESLDYDVVDAKVGDQYVMPFLHRLKGRSMAYMVKPFHATGSSDADFALLTTSMPNGRITPFKVVGFPFDDSLPWLVERLGYKAVAIHGNTGAFFQRRDAYEQMGFSNLYFDQELDEFGVDGEYDDEILQFSARLIRESRVPMFHFVITWTSHGPFDRLPTDAEKIYPKPKSVHQRYVNSMRYVDRALERYYAELPDDTTIVIYGDHHSYVRGYTVAGVHNKDRVPWIVSRKGRDLAERQMTRETGLATSGKLSQLDMACYLRDSLQAFGDVAARRSERPNLR